MIVVLVGQECLEFGDGADVGIEAVDAVAIRPGGLDVGEVFVEVRGLGTAVGGKSRATAVRKLRVRKWASV
jgi:hypothetical protein